MFTRSWKDRDVGLYRIRNDLRYNADLIASRSNGAL